MDGITFDNLGQFTIPMTSNYSSDSYVNNVDKIIEQDQEKILRELIGGELFNKLSYIDRVFMIETSGSIDFGHAIDMDKISQEIKEYDN